MFFCYPFRFTHAISTYIVLEFYCKSSYCEYFVRKSEAFVIPWRYVSCILEEAVMALQMHSIFDYR